MIVLYGNRKAKIYSKKNCSGVCANCGVDGKIAYDFYGNYIHFFFLPLFPAQKTSVAICQACGFTPKLKQLTQRQKDAYIEIKKKAKTPIWMWLGTILFGLMIVGAVLSMLTGSVNTSINVSYPKVGDVYTFEGERFGPHIKMEIQEISGETAWFVPYYGKFTSRFRSDSWQRDMTFSNQPVPYTFESILKMYHEDEITHVRRSFKFRSLKSSE